MEYFSQKLVRNEYIEKRIGTICSYNASKMEVIEGHIINVSKTNVSFIEPHKIIITTKEYMDCQQFIRQIKCGQIYIA